MSSDYSDPNCRYRQPTSTTSNNNNLNYSSPSTIAIRSSDFAFHENGFGVGEVGSPEFCRPAVVRRQRPVSPLSPAYKSTNPSYTPTTPAYKANTPAYKPTTPAYRPTTPAYKVNTPAYKANTPAYKAATTDCDYSTNRMMERKRMLRIARERAVQKVDALFENMTAKLSSPHLKVKNVCIVFLAMLFILYFVRLLYG